MANYYARVELHGADSAMYERLHAAMEIGGYLRVIVIDGKKYKLPTGSYWKTIAKPSLETAAATAHAIAATVQPTASVVVVEAASVDTSALEEA